MATLEELVEKYSAIQFRKVSNPNYDKPIHAVIDNHPVTHPTIETHYELHLRDHPTVIGDSVEDCLSKAGGPPAKVAAKPAQD